MLTLLPRNLREQLAAIDPARDSVIPPLPSAAEVRARDAAPPSGATSSSPTNPVSASHRGRWLAPILAAASVALVVGIVNFTASRSHTPSTTRAASPTTVKQSYPQVGRIIDTRPGRFSAALVSHAGAGRLVIETSGGSGCPTVPDMITVESSTFVTLHLASLHRGACPANLVSFMTTFTTPGLDDNAVITVKIDLVGFTPGSTQTNIITLPPASADAAAGTSPAKVLLSGRWLLRTLDGPALGAPNTPDQQVTITFGPLPTGHNRAILTLACNTTTATLTATSMTFDQPWHPASSGCTDLGANQARWLYTQLLTGTVSWHGMNATITITKPGVGTATFLYIR